jgi:exopolysaccharide biosynthesis polyprenyl glycosylphosphotransferase
MTGKTEVIGYRPGAASLAKPSRRVLAVRRPAAIAWLLTTDSLALVLAFALAYWVRFELQVTVAPEVTPRPEDYRALSGLLIPLWLLVFVLFGLYQHPAKVGGPLESSRIFNASTIAAMLVIVLTFLFQTLVISRMWLVSSWLFSFLLVSINRFAARRLVYALRRRGYLMSPTVIVGTNPEAVKLATYLGESPSSGVQTVGFVSTTSGERLAGTTLPVLGSTVDIAAIVEAHDVEDVIVAITDVRREELLRLCEDLNALRAQLRLSSGLHELLTTRVVVHTLGTVPLMSLQKNRLDRAEVVIKAILDVGLALAGLVLLTPLLLALAVLIKLDSPGPVIHRRRVLGSSGRQFEAYKFRTMHVNGDELLRGRPEIAEALKTNQKLRDDPRVTRVGQWLRRYSLDELPQLINVLQGQMSLVGPRMISPEEAEKYGSHLLNLLTVKPGMTGLWQVSGRSDRSYEERVQLDMFYVRSYSVWLDLQILFVQTLPAVLKARGAY